MPFFSAVCRPYLRPSRAMFSRWPGADEAEKHFMEVGRNIGNSFSKAFQLLGGFQSGCELFEHLTFRLQGATMSSSLFGGKLRLTQIGTNHNTSHFLLCVGALLILVEAGI